MASASPSGPRDVHGLDLEVHYDGSRDELDVMPIAAPAGNTDVTEAFEDVYLSLGPDLGRFAGALVVGAAIPRPAQWRDELARLLGVAVVDALEKGAHRGGSQMARVTLTGDELRRLEQHWTELHRRLRETIAEIEDL